MDTRLNQWILMASFGAMAMTAWAAPENENASWRTYRSPDYGFKIDYPANLRFYPGHPLRPPEASMFPICDYTVACFQSEDGAFKKTPLQAAGVSVNILRDKKTEVECNEIDTGAGPIKTVVIHGILFHYGDTGEAGGSSSRSMTAYRAFHEYVCFEVALVTAWSDLGPEDMKDDGLKPVGRWAMHKISREMDKMLSSFAFTGPVRDGANWNVFSDEGCGGVFEYPAKVQVQKKIEYSNAAFDSDDIACEQAFIYQGREYQVAAKLNLKDEDALNAWLSHSGYPSLDKMRVAAKGAGFTEFRDATYVYLFDRRTVFIFAVSDGNHQPVPFEGDRVFEHLLESFRE